MDTSGFVKAIIAAVVMIVIVVVVVIPVIQTTNYDIELENEQSEYLVPLESSGTIAYVSSSSYSFDGETISITNGYKLILMSDTVTIRIEGSHLTLVDYAAGKTATGSVTVTPTSYTVGSLTGSLSDPKLVRAEESAIGVQTANFHLDRGDTMRFARFIDYNGSRIYLLASGTPDALTGQAVLSNASLTNVAITLNEDAWTETDTGYLIKGAFGYTLTATIPGDTPTDVTLTGTNAVTAAPAVYHEPTHSEGAMQSLIGIVPLLMIVGVFVMIAGVFVVGRMR